MAFYFLFTISVIFFTEIISDIKTNFFPFHLHVDIE